MRPLIDWELCQGCDPCEAKLVCKPKAIIQVDLDAFAFIENTRCNGCNSLYF